MKFISWSNFFKRRNQIVDEKITPVIAIEAPVVVNKKSKILIQKKKTSNFLFKKNCFVNLINCLFFFSWFK